MRSFHGPLGNSLVSSQSPSVLPLPLTPFEQYMLADDRKSYPMTFFVHLEFTGEIDRSAFEQAVRDVLPLHPLLRAQIKRTFWGTPKWIETEQPLPTIDWDDLDVPIHLPHGEAIDLSQEPGFRIWVRQGAGKVLLITQLHHACSDGVAVFQFLGDLLAAYGVHAEQSPAPVPREVNSELLMDRQILKRGSAAKTPPPQDEGDTDAADAGWLAPGGRLHESVKALSQWPVPLCTPKDSSPGIVAPGLHAHSIDSKPLRAVAKSLGVSLNDLLLRDLFLTLREWNRHHGKSSDRDWLRINMPTNLRGPDDRNCPVTNILGYAFITRRASECDAPGKLLSDIQRDTTAIKQSDLGGYFPAPLATVSRIKGAMSLFAASSRCFATAVLSNIGDPSRRFAAQLPRQHGKIVAGQMVLDRILGAPPLRPKTHAAFLIVTYAQKLTICVRSDPHFFSDQSSRELLDAYFAQLESNLARN